VYRLKALAKGRVQGVGYRYHVQVEATKLKLLGYAKNLDSGEVEVYAEGAEQDLLKLLNFLYSASPYCSVESVETLEFVAIEQPRCTRFSSY
jgi:acylphosphatase